MNKMENKTRRKRNFQDAKNVDIASTPQKVRKNVIKLDKLPKTKLTEKCEYLQKELRDLKLNYESKISSLNEQIKNLESKVGTNKSVSTVQTQTYPQNDIDFNCGVCVEQFTSEENLWSHMDNEHDVQKQEMVNVSECESCEEKFAGKSDLMYHIKDKHHILTMQCKYFARGICNFNESTCWFSHKITTVIDNLRCKYCGERFQKKYELMKHRKNEHEQNVALCRENINGKCKFNDECWFKHKNPKDNRASKDKTEGNEDFVKETRMEII